MIYSRKKLEINKSFMPCSVDDDEELFPNGIFVFNITKLLLHIKAHSGDFPPEEVDIRSLPASFPDGLNEETVLTANLSNPIILAEISPGRYNLIDGHHRLEKARRECREKLPAYKISMEHHLNFLTSVESYNAFVQYWNSKLDEEYEGNLITLNDDERDHFVDSLLSGTSKNAAHHSAKPDFRRRYK
jgi:hypothetical protein